MLSLVVAAMLPLYPRTSALPGLADCEPEAFLRRYRAEMPARVWAGLVLAALLWLLSPPLTLLRPQLALDLAPELAERHIQALCQSRWYVVRQLMFLLKMTAGMAWGQDAKVRAVFALPALPADPGSYRGM